MRNIEIEEPLKGRGSVRSVGRELQPTAVLWGDRDPFFGVDQAERDASAILGATLRIETGAGHFLPAERPAAFVDLVGQLHTSATRSAP